MDRKRQTLKYYSPLRYPGGKGCIFSFVSNLFYENGLLGASYAEPYAGGSGLALRLLFEGYVDKIYINDLDKSIFSFWKIILQRPEEFCEWIKKVKVDVKTWNHFKKIQSSPNDVSLMELAQSTFFLNRTNISGVIKGGIIGGYEQKGKYKMDARFNKEDLIKRIERISSLKDRIHVSNLDGVEFLRRLNRKKESVFIYIDPPYYHKGADLYMNFYTEKDHQKLQRFVSKLDKLWMVSYDNSDFILNLYEKKSKVIYKLAQCASNRIGDEVLIFSENLTYNESINELSFPVKVA